MTVKKPGKQAILAVFILGMVLSFNSLANGVIEIRDTLRGVTFYSIELSSDPINDLKFVENLFPDNDSITIGVSALFFDGSKTVDEYIVWFHHNGDRRWFSTSLITPLTIQADDMEKNINYNNITTTNKDVDTGFSEKLEFRLSGEEFLAIIDSDLVAFELSTVMGNVTKTLSAEELTALLRFDANARKQHSKIYSGSD